MTDKTFIVTHAKARSPITIKGKTLEEALKKERLDPTIWTEQGVLPESEVIDLGETQGNAGQEDN